MRVARLISIALVFMVSAAASLPAVSAQAPVDGKPLRLPFRDPPGPDTWLLGQTYGNTVGAYRWRFTMYGASQGIHFGVDFSAACGTEVVAVADGVVLAVDNLAYGSGPHNLIIDHAELGYTSLYGHLLERPALEQSQTVRAGEVVGLSGDPAETCHGRPHLHLEIRVMQQRTRKVNPVTLIDADWDNLALIGAFGQGFERDLDEPRKWQHLADQPDSVSGGPILNDFANPWPPPWSMR
jgi:murein DD-endopeptidase MepM/ murein hydrolase activator NlpD